MRTTLLGTGLACLCLLPLRAIPQPEAVEYANVAADAGLTAVNVCGSADHKRYTLEVTGSGCAFFDYDRDGMLDILLVGGSTVENFRKGGDPLCILYRNRGGAPARFDDVTQKAGMTRKGWGMGVSIADFDNDGWEDAYVTGFGSNVLYRNNAGGGFIDVTQKAGVADGGWSTGSAFGDYDRDGLVDLFVVHYLQLDLDRLPEHGSLPHCRYRGIPVHCGPKGLPAETGRLYRNTGSGRFADVTVQAGLITERVFYGFTPIWTDYDDDGLQDLFVANDSTPNLLYRNTGKGTFAEEGLASGLAVSEDGREQACMGADVGDMNNDGLPDVFVTNFSDDYSTLYRHDPGHSFSDISTRAGIGVATWNFLGWGTAFVDYDNDGLLDIFSANGHIYPEVDQYSFGTRYRQRNQILRNMGAAKFEDMKGKAGPGLEAEKSSRGSAVGDFDNDGDADILVVNINDTPDLLENRGGNRNSWIGFLTEGTVSNRSGIGSRIVVRSRDRRWTGEVRSGGSYISQNDRRVRFGLGGLEAVDSVEIRWPDGTLQKFGKTAARAYYLVRQGTPALKRL
jgi:hypothetical protein